MNKIKYLLVLLIGFFSCNTETPIKFSEEALNDSFISLEGESVMFKDILSGHEGQPIVIDIWASWCSDCIKGMPKVKELQKDYPDVAYLFLSLDRAQDAWKRGIKKYDVQGEHYYLSNGKKSAFANFVNIDWIPRYMVVDANGNIKLFKTTETDNSQIIEALE